MTMLVAGDTELDYVPPTTDTSNKLASMAAVQAVAQAYCPPIGAKMEYTGVGDPPSDGISVWVVADGRLIDRTTFQKFYLRTGHAYNNGVDPGGNKVRIPDSRGVKSVGALDMGTGAVTLNGSRVNTTRGTYYGETNHTTVIGEVPSHNHGGLTGQEDGTHFHAVIGSTGTENQLHAHNAPANGFVSYTGDINLVQAWLAQTHATYGVNVLNGPTTTTESLPHAHAMTFQSQTENAVHHHAVTAQGGGAAHNNVDPAQCDVVIVRIA